MEKFVNGTSQPSTTDPGSDDNSNSSSGNEVGPLSILPIIVSLFAVVAIAIAACVFYRKRQRERAQLLARQLRVTERRIDVVGSIRGKKDKDSGKTDYYPPTDVRASASEPSIVSRPIPGVRPHYVIRAFQPQRVPVVHSKLQTRATSLINSSACSCDYIAETSFCSTCKDKDSNKKEARKDASAGSLAVELATVPSLGSLSQLHTPSKPGQERKDEIRRTRSDTAGLSSSHHTHNITILAGIMNKDSELTTPSRGVLEWIEKSKTQRITTSHSQQPTTIPLDTDLPSTSYQGTEGSQYMSITTNEQEPPPPNTPVTQSLATSVNESRVTPDKALSYISEDTQSERWV